jgi:hypothetical protein
LSTLTEISQDSANLCLPAIIENIFCRLQFFVTRTQFTKIPVTNITRRVGLVVWLKACVRKIVFWKLGEDIDYPEGPWSSSFSRFSVLSPSFPDSSPDLTRQM